MKVPAAGNSICLICFPSCCFSSLLGIRFPHLFGHYSEAPLQGWRFFLGETLLCCLDDARCEGRTQGLSLRHSPLRPDIPSLRCLVLPWFCPWPLSMPLYLPLLLLLFPVIGNINILEVVHWKCRPRGTPSAPAGFRVVASPSCWIALKGLACGIHP